MSRSKTIEGVEVIEQEQVCDVLIWKSNIPLTNAQHKLIGEMLRREEKATGIKIMLVPFSVDIEAAQKPTVRKNTKTKEE